MYSETIDHTTQRVFEKIKDLSFLKDFYLAGGTALALQLGHRLSIDLDFFSPKDFSLEIIKETLSQKGSFSVVAQEEGTLHATLDGVKLTFLKYRYEMLFDLLNFSNVSMADKRDIAAMKIDAISSRGSKKDFIDVFFLLQQYQLSELLKFFEKKFSGVKYNTMHIRKSLVYFETADSEPMPNMLISVDWEEIKKRIISEALNLE